MPDQENESPRTLRLTFRSGDAGLELVDSARVDMITPPTPGERPRAGVNGGFWFELRDRNEGVLAHRVVPRSGLGSAEVFSPDGSIRREFGPVPGTVFEVLLPDEPGAVVVALIGEPDTQASSGLAGGPDTTATRELARFELPS